METDQISFEDLGLDEVTLNAVAKKGFVNPSPIQVLAIPRLLNGDANIIAKARTGTGKTAAFGLPLIQKLRGESDYVRALILEPTRELAVQTCTEMQSFAQDGYPRTTVVYGGASMGLQIKDLRRGCEIVVGTPGRIQDHIERGTLNIEKIDYFILDEGDEMLDMGFVEDIEAIFSKANPTSRILLFSATMPSPILKIAQKFMGDYEVVEEEGITEEPLLIDQKYWFIRESDKIEALVRLIDISPDFYGLVFTQTKADADMVSRQLDEKGYEAAALHGDIPQSQREKILARFRIKKTRILVATDVAARGIDITGLSHVVNYSLPFDGATYVHRIGRTGRAGTSGCAVTFVCPNERRKLNFLQSAVRKASKGEMQEEKIPSIDSVLNAKRERLFTEMKSAIEQKVVTEIVEKKHDLQIESSVDDNSETQTSQQETVVEKKVLKTTPIFEKMACQLCEGQNPEQVLAAVLALTYGKSIDKSHYGNISSVKSPNNSVSSNQIRLFVQLGRRDGYNARSIADYFSGLLHIPGRMVDKIDVASNFTLVSLPISEGNKVLEMAKRNKKFPHVHIDSKSGDNSFVRSRSDRHSAKDGLGKQRFSNSPDRGKFGAKFNSSNDDRAKNRSRINVHVATNRTGSASMYKKQRSSETF